MSDLGAQNVQAAVAQIKGDAATTNAGGGASASTGASGSAPVGKDGQAPGAMAALGWINREMHEKETMKKAATLGVPYVDIRAMPINPDLLRLITKEDAEKILIMPFLRVGQYLRVGVVNPSSAETNALVTRWQGEGMNVTMHLCTEEGLRDALKIYDVQKAVTAKTIVTNVSDAELGAYEKELSSLTDLKQKVATVSSEEALNLIEVGAIKTGASDIHYEPAEKAVRVRFRIDGILHKVFDIDPLIFSHISNQLKYKSRLKLNVTTVPQDGRYGFTINQRKVDVRVSAIPTQWGESFVCRLLDSGRSVLTLAELGFMGRYLEVMDKLSTLSHGMILVTGPTGSGKTTTLYSLLAKFNEPDAKVITLEDPIEYHVDGISQSQIDEAHHYGFADGLRSILRQDPDVVMIGEIRDLETATAASQAALTGHVVLSTLHTNSAIESLPRLVNMGLPEFMVAPSLHTIVAQRLVRKLCVCAVKKPVTPDQKVFMETVLAGIGAVGGGATSGEVGDATTSATAALTVPTEILAPVGCETCSKTGYRGRLVIAEVVTIDGPMQELILQKASVVKLLEAARKQGMITMQEDGVMKVLQGLTTIEEIFEATNV